MKKKNRKPQLTIINLSLLRDIIFIISVGLPLSVSSFFVKSGFDIIPKTDNYPRYITKINVTEALHKIKAEHYLLTREKMPYLKKNIFLLQ